MMNLSTAVRELYSAFTPAMLRALPDVYAEDIHFVDPLHSVHGLDHLQEYFEATMEGLEECRFDIHHCMDSTQQGEAVLFWTMHYRHRKLNGGSPLSLPGTSHIRYSDRVFYHRDYYDAGAMIYEHIPLVGSVIRHIKTRVTT